MDENLDARAIQELEEVLRTKIYPGTEIMKDVGAHHFVKAAHGSASVLVPQPSDDEHDPLNWTPRWKAITMFCATLFSVALNLGPLANAPMFGVAILVLGFSNFIWVPLSVCYGRRPVLIVSTLVCAISSIWRARATSYNSFMGASVLNGLAAGPCETVQPQIITDIIFLHDRGKYQTLYFSMYFASLMVGPIISGAMASNVGWRSFWWFNTALLLACFVLNVLLFPETRYPRPAHLDPTIATTDATAAKGDNGVLATKEASKETNPAAADAADLTPAVTHQDPWLGRGKPSKAQFKLFQAYHGSILQELWVPWYLHLFPIVEFASFVVSFTASMYLVVNLSQSQAFAAPPYSYSPQTIGLFNLAVLVGAIIGLFTNGPWSDWVAAYLTRRNGACASPRCASPP
ncbi:hypothetical protein G7054_g8594 [Neopestalotiopsis clavispora]|nr:hypothetical protein G7054_g8594 [Neopestalotiopsis clavispora]